jgi:hypothetical protein
LSNLDGFFSLRTPEDLLRKLQSDFARLREADPTLAEAQYAAFDFFVTAEHLPDWLSHTVGGSKTQHRAYPDGALVSHVANGAKHFHVDVARHKTVRDTDARGGVFDPRMFHRSVFDVPRLVIELESGATVDVLDVAERVVAHWQSRIP